MIGYLNPAQPCGNLQPKHIHLRERILKCSIKEVEDELASMKGVFQQIQITTFRQPKISAVVGRGLERLDNSMDVILSMRCIWWFLKSEYTCEYYPCPFMLFYPAYPTLTEAGGWQPSAKQPGGKGRRGLASTRIRRICACIMF